MLAAVQAVRPNSQENNNNTIAGTVDRETQAELAGTDPTKLLDMLRVNSISTSNYSNRENTVSGVNQNAAELAQRLTNVAGSIDLNARSLLTTYVVGTGENQFERRGGGHSKRTEAEQSKQPEAQQMSDREDIFEELRINQPTPEAVALALSLTNGNQIALRTIQEQNINIQDELAVGMIDNIRLRQDRQVLTAANKIRPVQNIEQSDTFTDILARVRAQGLENRSYVQVI